MSKKNHVTVIDGKALPAALLEIGTAEQELAEYLEVDLTVSVDRQLERIERDAQQGFYKHDHAQLPSAARRHE